MSLRNKYIQGLLGFGILIASVVVVSILPLRAGAAQPIVFPVVGKATYSNDFSAARSNGRHNAIDIIANKHQPIVSAVNGTITFVGYPQPSWGYAVYVKGDDGFTYRYLHINNDTPGTDDGRGDYANAYAPDIRKNNRIYKGQLIGWVGDSGNAESTVSHLHFEMVHPNGSVVNPYLSLRDAQRIGAPAGYPSLVDEIRPYGFSSTRRLNITMGNIDNDPEDEVISGNGPGVASPQIQIYNADRSYIGGFTAYHSPNYPNGADVATADIDGDNVDEIITGAGTGVSPSVKVFRATGAEVAQFMAYESSAQSGLSVAGGDIDDDGVDEIIVTQRAGAAPLVKIFKANLAGGAQEVGSFYAYSTGFTGGVDVTAADVTGNTSEEIVTSPISSGSPDVRVYSNVGTQLNQFYAYDQSYRGGVRVSAGNVRTSTSKAEILTVPVASTAHVKMFTNTGSMLREQWFIEEWWRTTFDVAAGNGDSIGTAGVNRRTTVRLMSLN